MEPKNRDRFLGKLARRLKYKAAGDFSFEAYITSAVRKKIAENTAVKDVLPISNLAIAGFGWKIITILSLDVQMMFKSALPEIIGLS